MAQSPATRARLMSNDAYAGFLRLLLTPLGEVPSPCAELDAYLAHLNTVMPLHGTPVRRPVRRPLRAHRVA